MHFIGIPCFIIAMGVTWMVTPLAIRVAHALGAVDHPAARKVHSSPIPRIGGVAVYIGFLASLVFAALAAGLLSDPSMSGTPWAGLAVAASGMLLVGLWDDLRGLSFGWKFAAQIVAASWAWSSGFSIESVTHPLGGTLDLGLLSFPATVLWIVAITNAVNLIDGLDGLAAGTALITTGAVAVIAFSKAQVGVTAASVALAGALLGFLRYNFNPARIFLGDSGSMFLGFVLAVTSVRGSQKGTTAVAILVPLLVLGLPVLDTGLAVVRRLYRVGNRGAQSDESLRYIARNVRHVFLPDREHIHHRLIEAGLSHRQAVLTLYGVGVVFALAAFSLVLLKSAWMAILLILILGASLATFFVLLYPRLTRLQLEREAAASTAATARSRSRSH